MLTDALPNLLIGLREGLEAGLIVSILVATVVRLGRRDELVPLWLGVLAAAALSLAFGAVLTFAAADLSDRSQEVIGGLLSIVAVGFVTWMVFWMRRSARRLSADLQARTESALVLGSRVILITVFLAVAREGLETALFLWSTTRTSGESTGPLIGALLGFLLAATLCWGLYRRALKINLSRFFTWTGAGLIVVAAGVLAYGVGELQGAEALPGAGAVAFDLSRHVDQTAWYARIVEGVFNVTATMTVAQVAAYVGYLVVVLVLFLRAARRTTPAPATPAPAPVKPAEVGEPGAGEPVGARLRRPLLLGAAIVVVAVLAALAAIVAVGSKPAVAGRAIEVSATACAPGWKAPTSGATTFEIRNSATEPAEIYLETAGGRGTLGEVEGLAPGTSRTLVATLAPGAYRWRCVRLDGTTTTSSPGTVTGTAIAGVRTYLPVTAADLDGAVTTYRAQVGPHLATLVADTDELQAAVHAGDLVRAKALWVTAHQDYERLGAAYGTFGDLDGAINGRPNGLPGGVADPDFAGFLRLEHDLWQPTPGADLAGQVDLLAGAVHQLATTFPTLETDPADLPLRAHEILENTLQFELTGQTDQGSHTNLATARANVDGTRLVLDAIAPLLRTRNPQALAVSQAGLEQLAADLDRLRGPEGTWTPLDQLTTTQRQRLDGLTGQLLEDLAPIPDQLELAPSGN